MGETEENEASAGPPLVLPAGLPEDERYFELLAGAIRKCLLYKPKFGQGRENGISAREFADLYGADPFYHWIGIDSPLMYAAHKAAGGMTSVYRQIGIGSQWVFTQMLQDHLSLSVEQAAWSYGVEDAGGKARKLALDGRISLEDVGDPAAHERIVAWLTEAAARIGLPADTLLNLKGIVFEAR